MSIEDKLVELGITLPTPAAPVANYVPFVISGNLLSISGQVPFGTNGLEYIGKTDADITPEDANKAARLCAINLIAHMKAACGGDLERVQRVVKLGGFVNCTDDFTGQPAVINGASDLMVAVFGDKGRHSRSAVGVNALPLGVSVEIDALVEIS
mgnify:CR=1 FL=1